MNRSSVAALLAAPSQRLLPNLAVTLPHRSASADWRS
jgi:hypothetical protein